MSRLKRILSVIRTFLAESWEETGKAAVASTMWVEGYTDHEINQEIQRLWDTTQTSKASSNSHKS